MKIHIKILLLSVLTGLNLMTGCKKDEKALDSTTAAILPPADHQAKEFLPVQIGTNDPKIVFSYTSAHSLSKIEYKDGKSTVLNYSPDGKPVVLLRYQGNKQVSSTEYQLDKNGMVIRGDQFKRNGIRDDGTGYYTLTYNTARQLTAISYYDPYDKLTGTQQRNYDAAGNLVSEKSSSAELTTDYIYDDRKGIFKNVNYAWLFAVEKESGLFLSVNHNIRACNYPNKPSDNQIFSYIYNSDQYPGTISVAIQGGISNDKVSYQQIQ